MGYTEELERKIKIKTVNGKFRRECTYRKLTCQMMTQIGVRRTNRDGQNQDHLRDDAAASTGIYGRIGDGPLLRGIGCRCGSGEVSSEERIH